MVGLVGLVGLAGWSATLLPSSRGALLELGARRWYEGGTRVIREGDDTRYVILLRAGCVKITGRLDNGSEALLALRARGDIVGEMLRDGEKEWLTPMLWRSPRIHAARRRWRGRCSRTATARSGRRVTKSSSRSGSTARRTRSS
ncbi:MAG: cyclic nucleotide-binding domain-containing protein [Streptosporangiales bacterium]|nr:cyclic nucleotide-binding domain-containing protein [Streptosporangiales bacterium]